MARERECATADCGGFRMPMQAYCGACLAVRAARTGVPAAATAPKASWASLYAMCVVLVGVAALAVCIGVSAIDRAHEARGRMGQAREVAR